MTVSSSQCDALRDRAKVLRQGRWSDGAEDASMMEEAANAIESLRGRLEAVVETCERVRDDVCGLDVPHNGWYVCSKCGEPLPIVNRYCGGCGAIVRKVDA